MTQPKLEFARIALQRIALVALAAGLTTCAAARLCQPQRPPQRPLRPPQPRRRVQRHCHIPSACRASPTRSPSTNKLGYQAGFAWTPATSLRSPSSNSTTRSTSSSTGRPSGPPRTSAPGSARLLRRLPPPSATQAPARPPRRALPASLTYASRALIFIALHDF